MFTLEKIQMWERIADSLALALSKTIAEEALVKCEQRSSTGCSSICDAVVATESTGKITFINSVAENLTDRTVKEAVKKTLQNSA